MTKILTSRHRAAVLASLLCSLGGNAVRAQTVAPNEEKHGLGLSVGQSFRYDNNVFRLAPERETVATEEAGQRHDWIFSTRARLDYARRFGIHRLTLELSPEWVDYRQFDQFDHVAQQAAVNWSGQIGSDGYYVIRYDYRRAATNPADQAEPVLNLIKSHAVTGDLVLRTGEDWQTVGGFRVARNRNSLESERGGDNQGWAADLGLRYAPSTGNRIESRYRRSRFDYPQVIPSELHDNSYVQDEVLVSGNWGLSSVSQFDGRISYQWRRHDNFAERDFSGWTGNLRYRWQPTGASTLALIAFRELGAINDASASYARSYGLRLEPSWDIDSKVTLRGRVEWRKRRFSGFSPEPRTDDTGTVIGLTTDYRAATAWLVRFGVNQERRRASETDNEYSVFSGMLSVTWQMP